MQERYQNTQKKIANEMNIPRLNSSDGRRYEKWVVVSIHWVYSSYFGGDQVTAITSRC